MDQFWRSVWEANHADRVGRAEHFQDAAYHLYVDMPLRSLGAKNVVGLVLLGK